MKETVAAAIAMALGGLYATQPRDIACTVGCTFSSASLVLLGCIRYSVRQPR